MTSSLAMAILLAILNGCTAAKVAKVPVKAGTKAAGGAGKAAGGAVKAVK